MKRTPHNPAGLTPAQVGRKPWRLLDADEIKDGRELSREIQAWVAQRWDATLWYGNDDDVTYRTRLTRRQLRTLKRQKRR